VYRPAPVSNSRDLANLGAAVEAHPEEVADRLEVQARQHDPNIERDDRDHQLERALEETKRQATQQEQDEHQVSAIHHFPPAKNAVSSCHYSIVPAAATHSA
jgi:hypothetical protein